MAPMSSGGRSGLTAALLSSDFSSSSSVTAESFSLVSALAGVVSIASGSLDLAIFSATAASLASYFFCLDDFFDSSSFYLCSSTLAAALAALLVA